LAKGILQVFVKENRKDDRTGDTKFAARRELIGRLKKDLGEGTCFEKRGLSKKGSTIRERGSSNKREETLGKN